LEECSWQTIWRKTVSKVNRVVSPASRAVNLDNTDRASTAGRADSRVASLVNKRRADRVRTRKKMTGSAALPKFC